MRIYVILNHAEEMFDISDVPFVYNNIQQYWGYDIRHSGWKSLEIHKEEESKIFDYLRTFVTGPEQPMEIEL